MKSTHVGMGVVIIEDAFEVDADLLSRYLTWLGDGNEQTFIVAEDGTLAINQTGFKFDVNDMNLAPGRFLDLDGSRANREPTLDLLQFRDKMEEAAYSCLVEYCSYFPDAATTSWWRPSGHIAYYGPGQRIGPHCDDQIPFEWGESPQNQVSIHNNVSINLYLNNYGKDYSGGQIRFPQIPYLHSPKVGSAAIYPSNYIGRHEVLPVTSGLRVAFLTMACYGVSDGMIVGSEMPYRYWMPNLIKDLSTRRGERQGYQQPKQ